MLKVDFFHHRILARFKQAVEAAQDEHRQNDIAILATHIVSRRQSPAIDRMNETILL
jgi:hypothetical protein